MSFCSGMRCVAKLICFAVAFKAILRRGIALMQRGTTDAE
jgi:hypothetical protein